MKQIALLLGFLGTFAASACGEEQIRFRLDVDAFGNAKISVAKAEGPLATASGDGVETYKSSRLPKTRIDRTKGLVRLVHDFADADSLEVLSLRPPQGVEIDKRFDVLTLTSKPGTPAAPRLRLPDRSPVGDSVRRVSTAGTFRHESSPRLLGRSFGRLGLPRREKRSQVLHCRLVDRPEEQPTNADR